MFQMTKTKNDKTKMTIICRLPIQNQESEALSWWCTVPPYIVLLHTEVFLYLCLSSPVIINNSNFRYCLVTIFNWEDVVKINLPKVLFLFSKVIVLPARLQWWLPVCWTYRRWCGRTLQPHTAFCSRGTSTESGWQTGPPPRYLHWPCLLCHAASRTPWQFSACTAVVALL